MRLRQFAIPIAVLFSSFAGCSSDNPPADVADGPLVCGAGSVVAYNHAGCGTDAPAAYCQGPTDACVTSFCDCDGTTHAGGCGFALRPYQHAGACENPNDSGGPDVQTDSPTDGRLEAGNEGGNPEGGNEGGNPEAGNEGGRPEASPEAAPDAPIVDAPVDSSDSGDGALVCGQGFVVAYMQAGCGVSAPAPYCQGPTDACTVPYCDCDGTTEMGGCGFAHRPFRYVGACVDGGESGAD